jgi:hypothetical protein
MLSIWFIQSVSIQTWIALVTRFIKCEPDLLRFNRLMVSGVFSCTCGLVADFASQAFWLLNKVFFLSRGLSLRQLPPITYSTHHRSNYLFRQNTDCLTLHKVLCPFLFYTTLCVQSPTVDCLTCMGHCCLVLQTRTKWPCQMQTPLQKVSLN